MDTDTLLEIYDITLECQSPLEIRHQDGDFASGVFAEIIIERLRKQHTKLVKLYGECDRCRLPKNKKGQ